MFLEQIVTGKKKEIQGLKKRLGEREYREARHLPPVRSLVTALGQTASSPALIAEVKPASPSKGDIRPDADPAVTAREYEAGGAAAVSVLTEETYFKGSLANLTRVKESVRLPVLRKDFILDPLQLVESRLAGADAVLLIAAMLSGEEMGKLIREARDLGLEVLAEVHGEEELERTLAAGPDVLGINNRNLHTFETDLSVTERLRNRVPAGIPVIGESGVHSREDFQRLARAGVDGILVGEYLMRHASPRAAAESLTAGVRS